MKRVSLLLAVVLLLSVLPLGAGAAGTQLAFTQQPQDCTAMPGRDTAVFSVQAVGDPAPTYQWQLKKSDTWENLFLVTQPTYTISRVYPDMDGWQYRCLATSGEKTIASQVVTLHARLNDITLRQLAITPPVAGEVPMQELPETDQYRFPRGIFWDPELHEGTFAPDTVYTATVYLEAKPTYTLDGLSEDFFQVPGATEVSYSYDNRGVVTAVFPKTGGDPLHYPVSAVILEGEGTVTFSDINSKVFAKMPKRILFNSVHAPARQGKSICAGTAKQLHAAAFCLRNQKPAVKIRIMANNRAVRNECNKPVDCLAQRNAFSCKHFIRNSRKADNIRTQR